MKDVVAFSLFFAAAAGVCVQIFGKCACTENTEGDSCERCKPLYNSVPWTPGGECKREPNICTSKLTFLIFYCVQSANVLATPTGAFLIRTFMRVVGVRTAASASTAETIQPAISAKNAAAAIIPVRESCSSTRTDVDVRERRESRGTCFTLFVFFFFISLRLRSARFERQR